MPSKYVPVPKLLGESEDDLLDAVLWAAAYYRVLAFHSRDSRTDMGAKGFPDLVLIGSLGIAFVELKSKWGSYEPGQADWAWRIRSAAGRHAYYLWRPDDWHSGEIRRVIARLQNTDRELEKLHFRGKAES